MNSQLCAMLKYFSICLLLIAPSVWSACEKRGTICTPDCKGIQLCTAADANPIKYADCDVANQKYCKEQSEEGTGDNAITKALCTASEPNCSSVGSSQPACAAYGEFPHPTKCDRAIRCGGNTPVAEGKVCKAGEFIDPNTYPLTCTTSQPSGCPVDCNASEEGKIGIYCYSCTADGKIYLYTGCDEDSPTTPPPTPDPTQTPTDTPKPTQTPPVTPTPTRTPTPTPTPTPAPAPTCSKSGDVFPDPTECHNYYWCNAQLAPERKRCSSGRYFNKSLKRCIDGSCSNRNASIFK